MLSVFKDKDFTIDALRDAAKENVRCALRSSNESYFMRITNLVKAQTFMNVLKDLNSDSGSSQKRSREYTRKEDKAHIKRQSETIRELRAQIKATRCAENPSLSGPSSAVGGRGRGRGCGRGCGRGGSVLATDSSASGYTSQEVQSEDAIPAPSGSAALAFQAFCAEVVALLI